MKITNKLKGNEAKFNDLGHGDVFRYSNNNYVYVYMKMHEVESDRNVYNAVFLHDGDITHFDPTTVVEPIPNAELVI